MHLARGRLVPDEEWGGEDFGAQWIMCDGFNINETHLMVNDHTKHRKPIRRHPGSPSPIVDSVTVTNIGDRPANFAMQGGGNV